MTTPKYSIHRVLAAKGGRPFGGYDKSYAMNGMACIFNGTPVMWPDDFVDHRDLLRPTQDAAAALKVREAFAKWKALEPTTSTTSSTTAKKAKYANWICPHCTIDNEAAALVCVICEIPRGVDATDESAKVWTRSREEDTKSFHAADSAEVRAWNAERDTEIRAWNAHRDAESKAFHERRTAEQKAFEEKRRVQEQSFQARRNARKEEYERKRRQDEQATWSSIPPVPPVPRVPTVPALSFSSSSSSSLHSLAVTTPATSSTTSAIAHIAPGLRVRVVTLPNREWTSSSPLRVRLMRTPTSTDPNLWRVESDQLINVQFRNNLLLISSAEGVLFDPSQRCANCDPCLTRFHKGSLVGHLGDMVVAKGGHSSFSSPDYFGMMNRIKENTANGVLDMKMWWSLTIPFATIDQVEHVSGDQPSAVCLCVGQKTVPSIKVFSESVPPSVFSSFVPGQGLSVWDSHEPKWQQCVLFKGASA